MHALREPVKSGRNLRGVGRGQLGHRVVEYVPVELLELGGLPQVDPVFHGWARGIDRRAYKPSNERHPADNGACGTVHVAHKAVSGTGGHHRNYGAA